MRIAALAVALSGVAAAAEVVIDLGGCDWMVKNGNGSISVSASVPGQIHADLMAAGVLEDIYFGFNVDTYKWVANDTWVYSRSFDVDAAALASGAPSLVAEGLDTVAQVSVNGRAVLSSTNMFHTHRVPLQGVLQAGANTIEVAFASAVVTAQTLYENCDPAEQGQCPSTCAPPAEDSFCQAQYVRKEPCSFGWDWGPAFAPAGIWRPISVRFEPAAAITGVVAIPLLTEADARATAVLGGLDASATGRRMPGSTFGPTVLRRGTGAASQWTLLVHVHVHAQGPGKALVRAALAGVPGASAAVVAPLVAGPNNVSLSLTAANVSVWWPNGYGGQPLYTLNASVAVDGGAAASETSASATVGFRTAELVQDPLPGGASFYFRVNGVPVFVKGANWIPADALEQRVNASSLEWLLLSYQRSHFNMLRNWGGGIWQRDDFYAACDRLGLMVWNEATFACNDYPTGPDFLASVEKEVRDNVLRLQHHPSIVLWSGNNENEYRYKPGSPGAALYGDLYFGAVLRSVLAVDWSRPTVASSPSCGNETEAAPVCADPQTQARGDVHFYDYASDCWALDTFPVPRFASEYGYQSWAWHDTVAPALPADQRYYESEGMANRNHHPDGQGQMMAQVAAHFPLPAAADNETRFRDALAMTQVAQAWCIKTETEHYRRWKHDCASPRGGCTMGTLYWQANDIWPAASWSSVDWTGRWKVLQHYAAAAYAPLLASPALLANGSLRLVAVSDLPDTALESLAVNVTVVHYARGVLASWVAGSVSVAPLGTAVALDTTAEALLTRAGCDERASCFAVFALVAQTRDAARLRARTLPLPDAAAGGTAVVDASAGEAGIAPGVLAVNAIPLGSPANATTLPTPDCSVDGVDAAGPGGTEWTLRVSCAGVAAFATLEGPAWAPGWFDSNGFFLFGAAGGARASAAIGFHARSPIAAPSPSDFVFRTLADRAARSSQA